MACFFLFFSPFKRESVCVFVCSKAYLFSFEIFYALSMEGQDLGLDARAICSAIGQNSGLIRLDLSMTLGIDAAAVRPICLGCTKIQDLNLSWSSLDQEAIITICSNLPDTVTRLNLAGSLNKSSLNDEAVERLVTNCRNLKELDLSDNINITERGLQIINCLPQLESLSLNRCYVRAPPHHAILSLHFPLSHCNLTTLSSYFGFCSHPWK
uniref:Ribonuclease inhibitor n=1 Tax=Angiostrongylus cantonensis TaxID=6313 RepID=A0A0K0CXG9_ANGCA